MVNRRGIVFNTSFRSIDRETLTTMPKKHVLVIALPAYGHLIPTLELARKLSTYHTVTFAASRHRTKNLRTKHNFHPGPNEELTIHPMDDGIPEDVEDPKEFSRLILEVFLPTMTRLLQSIPTRKENGEGMASVDAVITDNFCGEPLHVRRERGIPYYLFHTLATRGLRFFMRMDANTKIVPVTDCRLFDMLPPPGKSVPEVSAAYAEVMLNIRPATLGCNGVIVNSFRAMDQADLDALWVESDFGNIPMFFVGPIFHQEVNKTASDDQVIQFLSRQPAKSVIYISFGSGSGPSEEQVSEIAKALIQLNRPFVWALRQNMYPYLPDTIRQGMQNDVETAKFIVVSWAPQKAVLASDSVGVFLSHCGWGGLMEGLYAGVPMVAWPMFGDQWLNAQWLAEHEVAWHIPETKARGGRIVPAQEIVEALQAVRADGSKYRAAADRWKAGVRGALAPEGSSSKELEGFAMLTLNMGPITPADGEG